MKTPRAPSVPRFSARTLQFIKTASRQKSPTWLDRNRMDYETHLLLPLKQLAQTVKAELSAVARGYHFPQKGIGRIKRMAHRVHAGGALYKDWISYSASCPAKSRFDHNPNLFFMIHPFDEDGEDVLVAGGLYMPSSRQVRAIREAIAADASAFDRLFASKSFAARFPGGFSDERKSSRVPRGFDPNHPRIEWLKLQAFFVWRPYKKSEFCSAGFSKLVARDFELILKLNELLDQALQGTLRPVIGKSKKSKDTSAISSRLADLGPIRREMDF
jgi:uncharacterized protein (TIGR02453 family)